MRLMDWVMGEFRGTGKKPVRADTVAAHTAAIEAERDRVVRRMADSLLAGHSEWCDPVMKVEVSHAMRLMTAAIALAFKELRK